MKTLSERFIESKGEPIDLNGELIFPILRINLPPGKHSLELRRISFKQEQHPGFTFRIERGKVQLAGQTLERFRIWAETSPQVVNMTINARKECQISLWNVWLAKGVTEAWVGQAGMKIKTHDGITAIACSGGLREPDFESLVVELEIRGSSTDAGGGLPDDISSS